MMRTKSSDVTRREWLRSAGAIAGGVVAAGVLPPMGRIFAASQSGAQDTVAGLAALAKRRTELGAIPIVKTALTDRLTLLSGPGGNVVALRGPDDVVLVDTFVQTAWSSLQQTLAGLAPRVALVINTHWHFDHTDNNENFAKGGITILAHTNTKQRLSEPHDLLGLHFDPSPAAALPSQTFDATHRLDAGGERLELFHVPAAHTDTDIAIHYTKSNVLHLGDLYFNGRYPLIDTATGGKINGMIDGANKGLALADASTKVVPGHGALGDKAALTQYRDMLVAVRDRVQKLKTSGRTLQEVVAAKPTAEFDATWGKGTMPADNFVTMVYNSL